MRRPRAIKLAGLAAVIVVALAWPYMASTFDVNLVTQMLVFGLFALSINIISGFGGMVTLGHAAFLAVAGYALAIFTTRSGYPLGVAMLLAMLVTVAVAAVFGLLAVRTRGTYFVMITLAEGMIVWGLAQRWSDLTGGDNGIAGVPQPSFTGEYWQYYYFVLAVVIVCTVLVARFVASPFGLSLKGIREAEDRLGALGYNVTLHKVVAFTVAGAFAGVAGMLLAMYNNFFAPTDAFFLTSAKGLLMSILGGVATLSGAFVGAVIVVFIQSSLSSSIERWQTLLGVIFVLVILLAPDGIVGTWSRVVWARIVRRLRTTAVTAARGEEREWAAGESGSLPQRSPPA